MPIPHMEYNDLKLPLSYSLVFQTFQQPTLTCHMSWQRASSAFLRLGSAASCAKTVAPVDKLCLLKGQHSNHASTSQTPNTWTHTNMLMLIFTFCLCRWGWPRCINSADSKLLEKHIRKYRRSAFRIATMKLPPIWESGSVWKLGTPGGKMWVYKNHAWPLLQPATKTVASVDKLCLQSVPSTKTVASVGELCLQSVPRDNNLLIAQPNKYRIREQWTYTQTQMLIRKCIGYADSKLREKHIRKYRRSALCIAVSRLICHMHREGLKFFLPFTSFFDNSDHLSSDSKWHWHTSTFSRLSSLDNLNKIIRVDMPIPHVKKEVLFSYPFCQNDLKVY